MQSEMATTQRPETSLLRKSLFVDGALSGVVGIMLLALASPLSEHLGLSVAFLRVAGLILLPWTVVLLMLAKRPTTPRAGIRAVIGVNLLWAAVSFLILAAGWVDPTGLGTAFVVSQALLVLGFVDAQLLGWRRQRRI